MNYVDSHILSNDSYMHMQAFYYLENILELAFGFGIIFLFVSLKVFTCPLDSFCPHRHPASQNLRQRSLHCAMFLPPLLQCSQKWVVIVHSHLQPQSQKMRTKRMSLVTAGVSCLGVMSLIIRSVEIALGLFCMT